MCFRRFLCFLPNAQMSTPTLAQYRLMDGFVTHMRLCGVFVFVLFRIAQIPWVIRFRHACPVLFPPDPVDTLTTPAARVRFKRQSRGTSGSVSVSASGRSSGPGSPVHAETPGYREKLSSAAGDASCGGDGVHVVEMAAPDNDMSSVLPGAVR